MKFADSPRRLALIICGIIAATALVACSLQENEIFNDRHGQYLVTLVERPVSIGSVRVYGSVFKDGEAVAENERVYGNDLSGDFDRHYPHRTWIASNVLRFNGNGIADSVLVVSNETDESIRFLCIAAGDNRYLAFDVAIGQELKLPFVGGNTSGWVDCLAVRQDSIRLTSYNRAPESGLTKGEKLVYRVRVLPERIEVEG